MKKMTALLLVPFLLGTAALAGPVVKPVVKNVTHFLTWDLTKGKVVATNSPKEIQIFVVGPEGISPAVEIAHSTDGTKVLLGSQCIAADLLHLDIDPTKCKQKNPPQSDAAYIVR